jgi:hypothetical protein
MVKTNLKGREEEPSKQISKPNTMVKTKPRKMVNSIDIPIESRIIGGNDAPSKVNTVLWLPKV